MPVFLALGRRLKGSRPAYAPFWDPDSKGENGREQFMRALNTMSKHLSIINMVVSKGETKGLSNVV